MADDGPEDSSDLKHSKFFSVLEYFKAHVTAIITLSTGSLVLSISFIKDLGTATIRSAGFLRAGWILFTVSIVAGVCYSYILTYLAKDPDNNEGLNQIFRRVLGKISLVLHFAFVLGIICFLVFALANLGAQNKDRDRPPPTPTTAPAGR